MSVTNEEVNKIVIRLHKEIEEASRTLGKVRRYGQVLAKSKLVSSCRGRLESIVAELKSLEGEYGQVSAVSNNSTTDSNSGRVESETAVEESGPGPDQSGASQVGGPSDTGVSDPE